ncbi:MAG TPA: Clp protease N-terminal domain-containing protein [Ktedonobacterales bacterium]|jgi:hypothetical protein
MSEKWSFDKFNEQARQAIALAQEEAQRFNHNYIGTEHLLLGLVRQEGTLATMTLSSLGVELYKVRSAVGFIIGHGDRIVLGEIGLTPRAKKVIELAVDEARRLNHDYIGPEHLLLGLVREGEGIAAGVLESLGVNLEKVRTRVIQLLHNPGGPEEALKAFEAERASAFASLPAERQQRLLRHVYPQLFAPPSPATALHIQASHPSRAPVGAGGALILHQVVIGTGGDFTLALYDGLAPDAPALSVITNPKTGDTYPFHVLLEHSLSYTLEGTPASVTILYTDLPN